jgi:hypothetical protein
MRVAQSTASYHWKLLNKLAFAVGLYTAKCNALMFSWT